MTTVQPVLPEITLYYAAGATDRLSDRGNTVYNEYIFQTIEEANQSGLDYDIATWTNINDAANGGNAYKDVIICTPQGKFVWHVEYEEDVTGELIENDSMYRAVGAPERFSEAVEYHLFWNKGSELVEITNEKGVYKAFIENVNGDTVTIQ
ncbi:hypothetical protein KP014_15330 [Paenibacillus sophorae]|nr:hypothetical protein [Paenibacillus sophorae]QWU13372.1 hypothetical protein KP014_15330 [Paenibacillus sophorae]